MIEPLRVSDKAQDIYRSIIDDLRAFYSKIGYIANDYELMEEIENRFGERISMEICPKLGIQYGACLAIAVQILRDGEELPPVRKKMSLSARLRAYLNPDYVRG
jgi:hypothetical protein